MNKKQRNRKIVKQNQRNRIINRRYSSTIKSLFKLFQSKTNVDSTIVENDLNLKNEIIKIKNNLYSVIDKSIKKGVLHKNTGARKKARVAKYIIKK